METEQKKIPKKTHIKVPITEYRKCKRRERQFLQIKMHIGMISNILKQMK